MHKRFFPAGDAEKFCENVFSTFDSGKSGSIDFKEFLLAIDVASFGPVYISQWNTQGKTPVGFQNVWRGRKWCDRPGRYDKDCAAGPEMVCGSTEEKKTWLWTLKMTKDCKFVAQDMIDIVYKIFLCQVLRLFETIWCPSWDLLILIILMFYWGN